MAISPSITPWQPGQLLYAGFEGVDLPTDVEVLLGQGRLGGVVLFSRNLRDPHQVRSLIHRVRRAAPAEVPVVLAIDQEGGRVQRLRSPWTEWPPMRAVGDHNDPEVTLAVGAALGRELYDLGIHLDFAPVVDVDSNPQNPIIGDRSLGREPERVAVHGAALVRGIQSQKVAACAKHFPGHGDTAVDSHLGLPMVDHTLDRLRRVELLPFRAAIQAEVAAVMTAHILFSKLDPKRPATLSPDVLAILREELGFRGVIFSDDLEMKAVAGRHTPQALVRGCLEAGVDVLLVCRQRGMRDEVLRALERAPDAWVERSLERAIALKQKYGLDPAQAEGEEGARERGPPYPEHQALPARLAGGV